MQIMGFNLTSMHIEKFENVKGKFKVTSSMHIKDIKEEKASPIQNQNLAKLEFEYNLTYEQKLAELKFKGIMMIMGSPAEIKDLVSEWKKKNTLISEFKIRIYNTIFHKCNLKALELEDEFGLPTHIQLPSLKEEEKKASYTG